MIFMEIWKGRTSCKGASGSPLLSGFPQWSVDEATEKVFGKDLTTEACNDYLAQTLACVRLISIVDPDSGFSGADYWNRHFRLFTFDQIYPLHEIFYGALGFSETRQYELFKLPRKWPVSKDEPEQQEAERLIEKTLTTSILKKLSHGPFSVPTMASLWDNESEADISAGTWGEYFRWATVYLTSSNIPEPVQPGQGGIQRIDRALQMKILEPRDPKTAKVVDVK